MNHRLFWYLMMIPTLFSQLYAQDGLELRFQTNMLCVEQEFHVTLQLRATQAPVRIGTSSILLSYNDDALSYGGYDSHHFDGSDNCIDGMAPAWEDHAFDRNSVPGKFNLVLELLNDAYSCPEITADGWVDVGTLRLRVRDNNADPQIRLDTAFTSFNSAQPNDGTQPVPLQRYEDRTGVGLLYCESPGSFDFKAESGSLNVTQANRDTWHTVNLQNTYFQPVVYLSLNSANEADPAFLRVRNTGPQSFEFKVDEWNYLDGSHAQERVSYFVVESGTYYFPDGRMIQAGITRVTTGFSWRNFLVPFSATPVVLAQVIGNDDPNPVITRMHAISTSGFELRMQEEENGGYHGWEEIAWIAITAGSGILNGKAYEVGRTEEIVNETWQSHPFGQSFGTLPALMGGLQTYESGNTASLRTRSLTPAGAEFKAEEEQSRDNEVEHNEEVVGYLAIEEGVLSESCLAGGSGQVIGEAGTLSGYTQPGSAQWETLTFDGTYQQPVAQLQVGGFAEAAGATVRVRNLTTNSLEFQLQEWPQLDGAHGPVDVHYLVVEAGIHQLPDGSLLQAGLGTASGQPSFHSFPQAFGDAPMVFVQTLGTNDPTAVVPRFQAIGSAQFEVRLQRNEQAEQANELHPQEQIGWIALEKGDGVSGNPAFDALTLSGVSTATTDLLFNRSFNSTPALISAVQTYVEVDPVMSLVGNSLNLGTQIKLAEESSHDAETTHAGEAVALLVFSPGNVLSCSSAPCPPQGTPCDDGNPLTENDVQNGTCGCEGTPIGGQVVVRAQLLLEGFYDPQTDLMTTNLNQANLLPLAQPYDAEPYHYAGTEQLDNLPAYAVDWVLVEVRDSLDPSVVVARAAGLLAMDGSLYGIQGEDGIPLPSVLPGNYYLVVYHRSHLGVISAAPIPMGEDPATYAFPLDGAQAMGNGQMKLKGNAYVLHAGDYDGNGIINNQDFNHWKQNGAAVNQYLRIDGDGNGIVNNLDYNLWTGNRSKIGESLIQQ